MTASSVYVALKMGALPWPIVFAAVLSLMVLKFVSHGTSTINEANVTHTIMSSGAMVAGGLAFTIPGAWMLGLAGNISWFDLLVITLSGSALGLVGSIALRKHFIEEEKLEYPIGEAAAQTLIAGDKGGSAGKKLFISLGLAGLYAFLRDGMRLIPSMLCQLSIPGVTFGIYNSPMMLSIGFLVGANAIIAWFISAVLANFGIIVGAVSLGICDLEFAQSFVSCLGMGTMMGCGIAVIARDIIPKGVQMFRNRRDSAVKPNKSALIGTVIVALVAIVICISLRLPPLASMLVTVCAFIACSMSAQSVGQTGIDPMEIFGLIVLLLVSILMPIDKVGLFFIAAIVAVACGLAGDVMNDFKAGYILNTSPKAQWIGQAIGGVVGSIVAVFAIQMLLSAYGPDSFGVGKEFVSAQASVVSSMVGGIQNMPAFLIGMGLGFILYLLRLPSMMVGLGIYLPFYMSLTTFLGCLVKLCYDRISKIRQPSESLVDADSDDGGQKAGSNDSGLIIASGLLGGESIMGIILAIIITATAFFA